MDAFEETKRDGPSSSSAFTWKIQSFSAFSKLKLDKHYSGVFSAGGFNWRLLVYPEGNNVEGYLSLYLELVDYAASFSSSSGCSEVYVDYTVSLLDQIRSRHKTFSGTWECLNDKQSSCCFISFILLDIFNDPSKGYLVDDTCIFNADVTVHGQGAYCATSVGGSYVCLTLEEAIPTKFLWKINGFSKLDAKSLPQKSKDFTVGDYKWDVWFMEDHEVGYLALYLGVAEPAKVSPDWEVYAEYSVSLVDQIHHKDDVLKGYDWFNAKMPRFVWTRFILHSDLHDPTKGFLINDTCIVEAEVSVPRIVNYCSLEPEKQRSCASCRLAKALGSSTCKFSWNINKFSELNTHEIKSEVFTSAGYKWRLLLFPRGKDADQLSMYLEAVESENLPSGWRCYAKFKLTLVNVGNEALTTTKESWHQFSAQEICWGFGEFMPLAVLFDKSRGYLTEDTLQVEAEVDVHRAFDYWTYDSRKATGYVCLNGSNSALNCYLQILYHIPFFRKVVLHYPGSGSYEPSLNIIPAMRHLFQKLENSGTCVSSNYFSRRFGYSPYGSCMWRDMHEMIRILSGKLEDEIRGTKIEDQVKQLFEGEFTKCVDCITGNRQSGKRRIKKISGNPKSKGRESFCDLLLDVKGCRDVYSSFDLILGKDHLDDASKYCSKEHALQDAMDGGLFFKFPPVLQLALKRFVFDSVQNLTFKIDDLYKFPFQLDLDRENGKYLSSDAVGTICNLYTLRSIIVHKGSLHSGHFYCLIRPNLSDQWLKFEDGRVTTEDLNLLSENSRSSEGEQAICSNVCMLVYIRECDKGLIFTSDVEVGYTKVVSMDKGRKEPGCKIKKISDESMYRIIKISRQEDFAYQVGMNRYFDLVDHENVCSVRVRNDMPFLQFKEELAREFGIAVQFQRFWLWSMHPNASYRPNRLLTPWEELLSIGMLWEMANVLVELNLFLDVELGPTSIPISPLDKSEEDILLFFKLYDPRIEDLRYMGRLYVKASEKPADILVKLNEMACLPANEEIDLFKEVGFEPPAMCERVDKERTFRDNMLKDGSIICYQSTLPIEERNRCLHPDVHSFLKFVREHQMWAEKRCAKIIDQRDEMEALFRAHKMVLNLNTASGNGLTETPKKWSA